jgi:hypothetical protein
MSVRERTRRYRQRNVAAGKCRWCPNPRFTEDRYECLKHYIYYYLRKRGLTKGVLGPTQKNRRAKFVAWATGRYGAIRNGYLVPGTKEDLLREVIELRLRIGIRWGGFGGADKMASLVRNIDLHAMRIRRRNAAADNADVPVAVSGPPLDEPKHEQ